MGPTCVLCLFCNSMFECERVGVKLCVFVLEVLIVGIAPKLLIGGVGSECFFISCGFICVLL